MDGEQRLKRLKRGEDSACLPWSVMVHQLKTSSCPSGALAAMGLGDGTDTGNLQVHRFFPLFISNHLASVCFSYHVSYLHLRPSLASDPSGLYGECCTMMGNMAGKRHCIFPASDALA